MAVNPGDWRPAADRRQSFWRQITTVECYTADRYSSDHDDDTLTHRLLADNVT